MVNKWLKFNHIAPGCWFCHRPRENPASPLCLPCLALLPHNRQACARCALPLPAGQSLCGQCLQQPPAYTRSLIPFRYARPFDQLIAGLKFQQRLSHARLLGELLLAQLVLPPECELLLPVPLHPTRLRQRGYNQALEIARHVSRHLNLPLAVDLCQRIRHTAAQTELNQAERRRNVHQAFRLTRPLPVRQIAILDDVVTTGHTVNELATCLKQAGAEQVVVIALARAVLNN